jgi:hypothetical protein
MKSFKNFSDKIGLGKSAITRLVFAALLLSASTPVLSAQIITLNFSGNLRVVNDESDFYSNAGVTTGTPISGSLSYDVTSAPLGSSSGQYDDGTTYTTDYFSDLSFSLNIGGTISTQSTGGAFYQQVYANGPTYTGYWFNLPGAMSLTSTGTDPTSLTFNAADWIHLASLVDASSLGLSVGTLPTAAQLNAVLADSNTSSFFRLSSGNYDSSAGAYVEDGYINNLSFTPSTQSTPEPSTWLLLLCGLGLLALGHRRKLNA